MRCNWETLYENICNCNKCGLCTKRNHVVVGMGDAHADVMLIGEEEAANDQVTLKDMNQGQQATMAVEDAIAQIH